MSAWFVNSRYRCTASGRLPRNRANAPRVFATLSGFASCCGPATAPACASGAMPKWSGAPEERGSGREPASAPPGQLRAGALEAGKRSRAAAATAIAAARPVAAPARTPAWNHAPRRRAAARLALAQERLEARAQRRHLAVDVQRGEHDLGLRVVEQKLVPARAQDPQQPADLGVGGVGIGLDRLGEPAPVADVQIHLEPLVLDGHGPGR